MYLTKKMKSVFLVLLSFLSISGLSADDVSYEYNLAVCAIFQNEAPYLREWIEFHKLIGAKHFLLYNHYSTDEYYNVLLPYIQSGEVELIDWYYNVNPDGGNWPTIQNMAYNDAIARSKYRIKWLAIIDIDEFLFPVETDNLAELLSNYEAAAAVCVNWQMYGTSGVKLILPKQLLIEGLIYKAPTDYPENIHVKSIVRPERVLGNADPHCCVFLDGFFQVDSDGKSFAGPYSPVKIDKIRINHYWTRDEFYFYHVKIPRRQKWQDESSMIRANNLNQEIDKSIFKYVPSIKMAMGY